MEEIVKKLGIKKEEILELFKNELNGIRSNRPHPGLVEGIRVDYLGSILPLKQIASIQISPPNSLIAQPWDKSSLSAIEKAIQSADLGVSTSNEGTHIRIILPSLSDERREELKKLAGKKLEEMRIRIRKERDEARKGIQKAFDDNQMTKDDKFKFLEDVQNITEEFNKLGEELLKVKEEELRK
jgi:ribosome recycling factor